MPTPPEHCRGQAGPLDTMTEHWGRKGPRGIGQMETNSLSGVSVTGSSHSVTSLVLVYHPVLEVFVACTSAVIRV